MKPAEIYLSDTIFNVRDLLHLSLRHRYSPGKKTKSKSCVCVSNGPSSSDLMAANVIYSTTFDRGRVSFGRALPSRAYH
jgi:hypothetical protein